MQGKGLWHQERGGTLPGHRQGPGVREDEVSWRHSMGRLRNPDLEMPRDRKSVV